MDVLTFETCLASYNEIIKQVTSSWSIFIQLYNSFFLTNVTHSVLPVATFQNIFFHRIYSNSNPISKLCTLVGYMHLIWLLISQCAKGYSLKPVRSVNTHQGHINNVRRKSLTLVVESSAHEYHPLRHIWKRIATLLVQDETNLH